MKRDMELIKFLLGEMESCSADEVYNPAAESLPALFKVTREELEQHCRLIFERGLAVGESNRGGWLFTRLTWDGHDFLDNSRNSAVWQATKRVAGNLSFDVFVKVMVEVASRWAMSHLTGF